MKNKAKKLIQKILFWDRIPSKLKFHVQCIIYSSGKFKFSYKKGVFETVCFKKYQIYTYEPPFTYRYYYKLFFNNYLPKSGDIIIDAGGFDGHVTCLFSKLVGDQGCVITFECDPVNLNKCSKNVQLNNIKNVRLIDYGLWSSKTKIEFFSNSSVASSAFYAPPDSNKIFIEVTSIDEYLKDNHFDRLDFIKMNIEGSEIQAVEGARVTLAKKKPNLAITADHFVNGNQTFSAIDMMLKEAAYKTRIKRVGRGAIVVMGTPM